MLDAQTIATVKAHHPFTGGNGTKVNRPFLRPYVNTHNPELKEIFNMSNQRNGDQREAPV